MKARKQESKKTRKQFLKACFFIFLFFYFFVPRTNAATIFSPVVELSADPGESVNGVVKLFNETSDNLFLDLSIEAFSSGDESGQPIYLPPEAKYDYLNWFTVAQDSIVLTPRQVALIPLTVNVPANAVPGGYYAVIFWQNTNAPGAGQSPIGINSRVGTLVFLKVNGEITESGELVEIGTKNKQSLFYELPINFVVRFSNIGNIHLRPQGKIKLTNIFGQTKSLSINSDRRNVLPGGTRLFEVVWGSSSPDRNLIQQFWHNLKQEFNYLAIGKYTATLELNYGEQNAQTVRGEFSFWVLPWRLIVAVLFSLLIFIFLWRFNRKINKLKKRLTKSGINE